MSRRERSLYIVNPVYDWVLFLLPPVLALWLGIMISSTAFSRNEVNILGVTNTAAAFGLGVLIHAHLVAVVFRSHANGHIFRLYPMRFVVVPVLVWLAIVASPWLAVTATVVATFWDVYHSGAQTFGFARIYDRNAGVPPQVARRLDMMINQLLYAGPILAGATLIDHLSVLHGYDTVGSAFFATIPARARGIQRYFTWAVVVGGTGLIAYYVIAHVRLYRKGYRFSPLKIFLVASTGACSIYTWGFNSWGEAFFIMNVFHAVQYLALVWAMEKQRMMQLLRVSDWRTGKPITAAVFLGSVFVYGLGVQLVPSDITTLWAITIVVALMHFWYDGFVWSVRAKQV